MGSLVLPREDIQPSYANGFAPRDGPPANPGLLQGLRGAWCPAMGVTGGVLHNQAATGAKYDASMANVTWDGPTQYGYSAHFTVGSDYISIPQSVISGPVFTIAWLEKESGGVSDGYLFCDSTDILNLLIRWGNGVEMTWYVGDQFGDYLAAGTQGDWHSGVVTHDGNGAAAFWVDGLVIGSVSGSNFTGLSSAFYIGNRPGLDRDYAGDMPSWYVWDRVLAPTEIQHLYRDHLAPFRLAPLYISTADGAPPAVYPHQFYNKREMTPLLQM